MSDHLSFHLDREFVDHYRTKEVPWGFQIGGGNSLGELTFLRTYSRKRPDGSKESWADVVQRCVEGCYSIQKDWCIGNRVPWDEDKAQRSAREMYDRMFTFKFTPPGRGLWMMGTEFVHNNHNAAALQNCAFVSTDDIFRSMAFLMEASMLGVGVGFDTRGAGNYEIGFVDSTTTETYAIPDTREGWVESTVALLCRYLDPSAPAVGLDFDYSLIRPRGEPIRGFGGTAAGPGPLMDLHESIRYLFDDRMGERMSSSDVVDIANLIGRCVVAGNVRRSAEIALGRADDNAFLNLKNPEAYPARNDMNNGWSWASNNSLVIEEGTNRPAIEDLVERIDASGGEPGLFWLDTARNYGRLGDEATGADWRAAGTNPCGEQTLESYECCNLVETYPSNHRDKRDFLRTLKYAYLFAKTVTLMPTHWEDTNAVMQRNRRIGLSMTGQVDFAENRGWDTLAAWMDSGYHQIRYWDHMYSEWLCVRESIKVTSVKPSGTVSLLAGVSPGVHWPVESSYIRRVRFSADDPVALAAERAGYPTEPSSLDPSTAVVSFPVIGDPAVRSEKKVSLWQKVAAVTGAQRLWADNQVSATLTYDPKTERDELGAILAVYEGRLKSASFLPMFNTFYDQMPIEGAERDTLENMAQSVRPIDRDALYGVTYSAADAVGEKWCDSEACEI